MSLAVFIAGCVTAPVVLAPKPIAAVKLPPLPTRPANAITSLGNVVRFLTNQPARVIVATPGHPLASTPVGWSPYVGMADGLRVRWGNQPGIEPNYFDVDPSTTNGALTNLDATEPWFIVLTAWNYDGGKTNRLGDRTVVESGHSDEVMFVTTNLLVGFPVFTNGLPELIGYALIHQTVFVYTNALVTPVLVAIFNGSNDFWFWQDTNAAQGSGFYKVTTTPPL